MGYAGYVPAKLPPPKPSELQAALWQVASLDSLDVLSALTRNIAVNPADQKFRKLRLSNVKVQRAVVDTPHALDVLFALGWTRAEAEADSLVYPANRQLTMAQVRLVDEAKDRLRRREKEAARSKASAKLPTTDAQVRVRAQMEADRLERASQGPVTQGSAAQPLPTGAGITTARDLGIGSDEQQGER